MFICKFEIYFDMGQHMKFLYLSQYVQKPSLNTHAGISMDESFQDYS